MESVTHETSRTPSVVAHTRDRLVAFHDRHVKVVPFAEGAAKAFQEVAGMMTSAQGKAAAERLRPHIGKLAKNAEVGLACADMVAGVVGSAVAVRGIAGGIMEKRRAGAETSVLEESLRSVAANDFGKDSRKTVIRGLKGAALSGVFWGVRPLTRLTHAIGVPLARRVALTMDHVLLRREHKLQARQVLVGSSKA